MTSDRVNENPRGVRLGAVALLTTLYCCFMPAGGVAQDSTRVLRIAEESIAQGDYDDAIDRNANDIDAAVTTACPEGIDVYFDNVGGPLLETVLTHINEEARILLCGSVATYNSAAPQPGPNNLFQLTTKHAHMHGFMTHLQIERYDAARATLAAGPGSGADPGRCTTCRHVRLIATLG